MKSIIKDTTSLQQQLHALEQEYQDNLKKDASLCVLKKILIAIRQLKLQTGEAALTNREDQNGPPSLN